MSWAGRSSHCDTTDADHNRKKTLMLVTNNYEVLPRSPIPALLIFNACLYSFIAALNMFLVWLSPMSLYVFLSYLLVGLAAKYFYFALEVSRRQRRGPTLSLSNQAVALSPMTAPINQITADNILLFSLFPVSLISVALTRTLLASSPSTSLTTALDVVCVALGAACAVSAVVIHRGTAYRLNTIHRGPILTLTPTHLEFHPLLEAEPIRIPWDRMPYLAGIDLVTVKRDSTKKARITTTGNPVPTTIDITCLDLTYEQLQRVIGCFACRPQYRGALATDGGVTLVRALINDNPSLWPR